MSVPKINSFEHNLLGVQGKIFCPEMLKTNFFFPLIFLFLSVLQSIDINKYSHKMYLGSNIKVLRNRKGLSQEALAAELDIKRTTLNNYENTAVLNPTIELLFKIAGFFGVSLDVLIKVDLEKFSERQFAELEKGHDAYITGSKLRVLTTTVDAKNQENIELVSVRARAGYMSGYGDPEYLKRLPIFSLPFLHKERKYRAFQINGDSMLPIPDKSYVVAEFVPNLNDVKNGEGCIIVTNDDGIVFKTVTNQIKKNKTLLLSSLNSFYEPFELAANKVRELWKFVCYISLEIPEPVMTNETLVSTVMKLQKNVSQLQQAVKK